MPLRLEDPPSMSLFTLCCDQFITSILHIHSTDPDTSSPAYKQWVSGLPTPILDLLTRLKIEKSLQILEAIKIHPDSPLPHTLISSFGSEKLSHLDLSSLVNVGSVPSAIVESFELGLSEALPFLKNLTVLHVKSRHSTSHPRKQNQQYLPHITSNHLQLIGQHCLRLQKLDVSYNEGLRAEDFHPLIPAEDGGCPELQNLQLFDCGLHHGQLAEIVVKFPKLTFLGYKEIGRLFKYISGKDWSGGAKPTLTLTHVNNIGSKLKGISGLRCKRSVTEAIAEINPKVEHLKIRVHDNDVGHLVILENVKSVELLYNVGGSKQPGPNSEIFLLSRGANLYSVAIICEILHAGHIMTLGENCPNLTQMWLRCNSFFRERRVPPENMFPKLEILYFRVGHDEPHHSNEGHSAENVTADTFRLMLQNGQNLKELIIAQRTNLLNDSFVRNLIQTHRLFKLEKILLLVPGKNVIKNQLDLTSATLDAILALCPNIRKIGNLLTWRVDLETCMTYKAQNIQYDLELMYKEMKIR